MLLTQTTASQMSFIVPCRYWRVCRNVYTHHRCWGSDRHVPLITKSSEGYQVPTFVLMESQNYFFIFHSSHMCDSSELNYVYIELLFHSEYQEGFLTSEKKRSVKNRASWLGPIFMLVWEPLLRILICVKKFFHIMILTYIYSNHAK